MPSKRKTPVKKTHEPSTKRAIKEVAKKVVDNKPAASSKYYAVGRRKCSVARVYYHIAPQQEIHVNSKTATEYFQHPIHQKIVLSPLETSNFSKGKWIITVRGGGLKGQAESVRLGISRLLVILDENLKPALKKIKFLTRDSRVKERKKYGLKRARRAPQWQKR